MRHTAIVIPLLVLLAGCNGGTVDQHALKNNEVANEDSTTAFTRVHAGELANVASNFEDALSKR